MKTILLVNHDCDLVLYKAFEALAKRMAYRIVIAAPEGTEIPAVEGAERVAITPLKSKFDLKGRRALRRAIRDTGADYVFCVSTTALANALAASRHTGAKVVGYRGTQARVHRFDPTYRMALLNRRVSALVCETDDILEYLSDYIPQHKLFCRPKPYMRRWIENEIANPAELEGKGMQIICVGMMKGRPHKGLRHLLDAMALLDKRQVTCHLTVIGSAEDEDIATAPANVTFTGPRRDAIRFIAASDVLAMPSTRDASPRVVREAQACGVACVVSDIPGARDLIIATGHDRSGVLVAPARPEDMADALQMLAENPDIRREMGCNGIRNIQDNYSLDQYVDFLENIFNSLNDYEG